MGEFLWTIKRWLRKWGYRLTGKSVFPPTTLKGTWTLEPAEDLMHVHGFDCEDELAQILTKAISEEIDETIQNDLYFREAWVPTMPSMLERKPNGCFQII